MMTIVPFRPAVNSNKNLYIYYISIHFYNCQNRTAVEPLVPHRSNCSHNLESIYTIYLYVFITVRTAPQSNRLSRTAQSAVTIQSLKYLEFGWSVPLLKKKGGPFHIGERISMIYIFKNLRHCIVVSLTKLFISCYYLRLE